MAIALFQVYDESLSPQFLKIVGSACPVSVDSYGHCGRSVHMIFKKGFQKMYNYCMDVIPYYAGDIAFLGVDETRSEFGDYYYVSIIDSINYNPNLRDRCSVVYYQRLIESFTEAINNSFLTYEEALTICQRCRLGKDWVNSVETCAKIAYTLSQDSNSPQTVYDYIESFGPQVYSEAGRLNTMVRVMVHFCLLRLPRFKTGRRR